mgnify:CR=1 FL=1
MRTRLTLIKPDLARRVLDQEGKMKHHYDAHAKPREMAVGDGILARDHQTSQKRQPSIVLERTAPLSYRVQLDDGRVWRRHADDVLLNSPNSNTTNQEAVQAEPIGPATQSTIPPDPDPDPEAPATAEPDSPPPSMPEPAECATHGSSQPRRSRRTVKPPQRLIEQA